ncbi:hypothetical protein N7492_007778 [Penicillium capsulatum]|uniref:Alpha/beta hydrolase fold-3 domain-containing protein n=1 Tax=Penicillium capsulatum TaxID=69766 RepID=A0A9W9I2J7_9EURO|nr:hypothetical protein N7492_007778 [Penicillium capsulatum]KAJ6117610.1 hypothetical protein N7512_007335 [Penicillium capsulatum]
MPSITRPPLHPDLAQVHDQLPKNENISTPEEIAIRRKTLNFSLEDVLRGREHLITHEETTFPGPAGPLQASIFRPKKTNNANASTTITPGILHIHGGGHIAGTRFLGIEAVLDWVVDLGAIIVSAEYRFAPEHPQPAQLEDSYAALTWMSAHAHEIGFSPAHLVVCGGSAGGNLAAGVFADVAPWTRANSVDACDYALGRDRERASVYTVPGRATDLSGLPATWIDVGDADVFRDEDVAYASKLWRAGVSTELHVWPGCWHAFDIFVPDAPVSRRVRRARSEWLRRLLLE